ncbi:MAG: arginine--tRNA ligase [Candidatus Micrarchaeota archaeon]|nr:arginine--tRNA ligase [Candidatus Micrarchaeota archaeon]
MYMKLRKELAAAIARATGVGEDEAEASVELPKGQFGDVASSICFSLAKKERKNPSALAAEVAGRLELPEWVSEAKTAGPYINFFLSDAFYAKLAEEVRKEGTAYGKGTFRGKAPGGTGAEGSWKARKGKTIIEFPSVNPNKPWHIGHLRNALLGDSVARVLAFSGENIERMDYIDDLGLQVAQSFWGYLHLGKKPSGKLDLWLGGEYVEAAKRFEEDENVQKEVRALVREMEEGEGGNARECRKLVEKCVAAQYETAFKFSIYHDVMIFESDILHTIFEEGMARLRENPAIVKETEGKNAGCLVAKMSSPEFANMESPDKILVRSDGTATYTGKDVIFQLWKFDLLKSNFAYSEFMEQPNSKLCMMTDRKGKKAEFGKARCVVNVIGMEQAYPQKVIREILLSMGYKKEAENSVHLSYEHVGLEDSKFSGRQGTWVGYTTDELYEEGVKRAEGKIKPDVPGEERAAIARAIAAAAIRFTMIRTTPEKRITFRWDDALSLEGDSAPYAIYAHARAHKIFEKGGKGTFRGNAPGGTGAEGSWKVEASFAPAEKELLKKVMLLDFVVSESARQLRPHIVADYCLDLAALYNKFYNACPILSCDDGKTREGRLATNYAAKVALANALGAIGVPALERM